MEAAETLSTQAAGPRMALSGLVMADLPGSRQDEPVMSGQGIDALSTKLQGDAPSVTIILSISLVRTTIVQGSG